LSENKFIDGQVSYAYNAVFSVTILTMSLKYYPRKRALGWSGLMWACSHAFARWQQRIKLRSSQSVLFERKQTASVGDAACSKFAKLKMTLRLFELSPKHNTVIGAVWQFL